MARLNHQPKSSSTSNLIPPDEKFWKRYSPHHEAILSGVSSLTLHGLALGMPFIFALVGALWARGESLDRPPNMAIVQLVGTGGEGGGGGGEEAPLGTPDAVEAAQPPMNDVMIPPSEATLKELPVPPEKVSPETPEDNPPPLFDANSEFAKITKEAKQLEKKAAPKIAKNTAVRVGPRGVATGKAGGKGTGRGPGFGNGSGGKGGLPGRPATKQEIFAQRWKFDLSGNGREHAEKLAAAGVFLVFHDRLGRTFVVKDIRRRPVTAEPGYPAEFKEAVKWYNRSRQSLTMLGLELGVNPEAIGQVEMLLPKDREEKMAEAEAEYARRHGRDPRKIRETEFDFRLRNGTFEPVVIRQN